MKKLLFTITFGVLVSAAFAQEYRREYDDTIGTYERVTERGPYLTGSFFDNWFIGVGGGVNMYLGSGDDRADFGDRLAPALDAYIGKWITPSVGIRFVYQGLSAKGAYPESVRNLSYEGLFSPINAPLEKPNSDNAYYKKEFDFWSVQGHFLWNISNAIGGYKETRVWDFIPYAGAGYMQASKHGTTTRAAVGYAGLLNKLRLNSVINIMVDGRFTFMKPGMDTYDNNKKLDGMVSLTAGLSFNLGPRGGFKRPTQPIQPNYAPYQERINALEGELSNANDRASRLARDLEECRNRPAPTPVEVEVVAPTPMHVYFKIGSARIAETDMVNIENIARTIKATPNKVYSVVGCADAGTGSAARNQQLSNQRAKAVADALTGRFGVAPSQLDVDAKGGISVHDNPNLDRVVIVEMKK